MRFLVEWCLRHRVAVLALTVALVFLGYRRVRDTPVDVFPEFAPPLVEVQTEAPGLSSLEVEELVSGPIERAVFGVPFLKTVRSKSVLGLSSVVMLFADGTDVLQARQLVQERISRVATQLPTSAHAPVMLSPLSSTSRILKIGITSKTFDQTKLTDLVRWTVRPRLLAVPGVANVAIWGERDRQLQVVVDPAKLHLANVSLDGLLNALRDGVTSASGGSLDTPLQRLAVSVRPPVTNALEVGQLAVGLHPTAPRVKDLAEVVESHPPPIGDAVVNDVPGLLLIVEKQPWGNTLTVTHAVEDALAVLKPTLADVEVDSRIFRPATFVERALANLRETLLVGCVLVIVILAAFLYDLRTACISMVAIPLSLLGAAMVLHLRGRTIDTMVIAGLAIALGEVVDDAIIDVENVLRRLRLEAASESPRPAYQVVLAASLEMRSAVVYATAIVVLVFLPVFFLDGLPGAFFRPLALSYVLAVVSSLVVALTVTPALCLVLLPGAGTRQREAPLARWLRRGFRPVLGALLDRPRRALLALLTMLGVAGALTPLLGESFLPAFRESDFLMHWVGKPGTSLEEMRRTVQRASIELRSVPGIHHFGSHIGRAEVADEVVGSNFAELWISVDSTVDHRKTLHEVNAIVEGYPGLYRDVQTYLQERIKEVLSGGSGAIVVRILGPDLPRLRVDAAAVMRELAVIPGVANLKVEPQVVVPQVDVRLRPDALAQAGVSAGEVQRLLGVVLQGKTVGQIVREGRLLDVVVLGTPGSRLDPAALAELRVVSATGLAPRLGDLASLTIEPAPNVVVHEGGSRKIDVSLDVKGRDLGAVAKDVRAALDRVPLGPGDHAEVVGEYATREQARSNLVGLTALSLLGIALLLYTDFRAWRPTAIVLATLPLALIGSVVAVFVTGRVVSLGSLVGFVTILGIAARNGIMLVSHYQHLETTEGMPFGRDLVLEGTLERLSPILMTALATGLALVPLIAFGERPGQEIEHPMAVVIVGGLTSSTLLNLLVMPSAYLFFHRHKVAS